jgi:hypothetical protein
VIRNIVLPILVLTAIYGLVIGGLAWLLRILRIPATRATFLAFLLFGLVTGLLTAWVWPLDSSVYANVFTVLLGDLVYRWSAQYLGDPWLLRVPHVYVLVSPILWAGAGLLFQGLSSWRRRRTGSRPTRQNATEDVCR